MEGLLANSYDWAVRDTRLRLKIRALDDLYNPVAPVPGSARTLAEDACNLMEMDVGPLLEGNCLLLAADGILFFFPFPFELAPQKVQEGGA